ncbi:unnamed protein product, partial [Urochloa humidicola]
KGGRRRRRPLPRRRPNNLAREPPPPAAAQLYVGWFWDWATMELEKEEAGVRRWLVDITRWRPSHDQFDAAAALLPSHERPAIARFVKEDDRKRALVSRLLQYSLVHHVLRIPLHQIDICRTPEGKPYLVLENCSTFPNFNFNTSHQGDYVGIASEPLCLVGLDIVSVSKPQGET